MIPPLNPSYNATGDHLTDAPLPGQQQAVHDFCRVLEDAVRLRVQHIPN